LYFFTTKQRSATVTATHRPNDDTAASVPRLKRDAAIGNINHSDYGLHFGGLLRNKEKQD